MIPSHCLFMWFPTAVAKAGRRVRTGNGGESRMHRRKLCVLSQIMLSHLEFSMEGGELFLF